MRTVNRSQTSWGRAWKYIGNRRSGGFTLLELLVVMAIVAIIAGISIPALSGIQSSYNLDSVGSGVAAQLNAARQNALASGKAVQVRFYQIADYNGSTTTKVYRAMQCFIEGDSSSVSTGTSPTVSTFTATVTPISKPYYFPAPIVMLTTQASGTDASGLLDTSNAGILSSTGDAGNPLPSPYGTSAYTYFLFRPNGQIDQSTGGATTWSNATLTFASENAAKVGLTGLPANYVTLEINAITGTLRVFRP